MNKFIDSFFSFSYGKKTKRFGYIYLMRVKDTNIYKFGKSVYPKRRRFQNERYFNYRNNYTRVGFSKYQHFELLASSKLIPFYDAMEVYCSRYVSELNIVRRWDLGMEYIEINDLKEISLMKAYIENIDNVQREICKCNDIDYINFIEYCKSNYMEKQ